MNHSIIITLTAKDVIELAKDKAGLLGLTKSSGDMWEFSDRDTPVVVAVNEDGTFGSAEVRLEIEETAA